MTTFSYHTNENKDKIAIGTKPNKGSELDKLDKSLTISRPGFTKIDITSKSRVKLGRNKGNTYDIIPQGLDTNVMRTRSGIIMDTFMNYIRIYPQLGHWNEDEQIPTDKWREWCRRGMSLVDINMRGVRIPKEVKDFESHNLVECSHIGSWYKGKLHDSIISERKNIFIPIYYDLLGFNPAYRSLKVLVDTKGPVLLLEKNGPSLKDFPRGLVVTEDNLKSQIENPNEHFGYSWVVAAKLTDIDILALCK